MNPAHLMKTLALSCLATTSLLFVSSCESYDEDHNHHRGSTTTTTTEETTLRTPLTNAPISSTTETQTTRTY